MFVTWYLIGSVFILAITTLFFPGWYLGYLLPVLVLFWLSDLLITLRQPKLSARRELPDPIYQNQETEVRVVVCNPASHPVQLLLKDEPPFIVTARNYQAEIVVPACGEAFFTYTMIVPRRGSFIFGDLNVRITGKLQLFSHQVKLSLKQKLRVYPNLAKLTTSSFSRLVGSDAAGLHRLKQLGAGGELAQLREYNSGDDYRKINWKVAAHRGKPVVNEYEPEKDQNVFLLFDTGRLLFDQVNDHASRLDYILDSAILLAFNIQEYGDMVGALSFNCKVEDFVPVGKGNRHLQMLINQLFDVQAVMVESDYRGAFNFWQNEVNKRSLIFIYTDLLDGESSKDLINYLKILSRHHLVVCVLSRQSSLDRLAEAPIIDEKSAFLKGTVLELLQERAMLINSLTGVGIKVLEVNPANINQSVIEHYIYLKNHGLF
jgi:uncharacterized protein (DUF58 family)